MKSQRGRVLAAVSVMLLLPILYFAAHAWGAGLPTQNERRVRLTITVIAKGGKRVANARVNVWVLTRRADEILGYDRVPDFQLDTDQEGVATVGVPVGRNYFTSRPQLDLHIRVVKTDFEVKADQLSLKENIPEEITRTVILMPTEPEPSESEQMNLVLRVVRANDPNSRPVVGAKVDVFVITTKANLASRRRQYSAQTGSDGVANVRVMPYTDFEVKVSRDGFRPRTTNVTLPAQQQRKLPKEAGPFVITLEEYGGSEVTFVVTDRETGEPLREAEVTLDAVINADAKLPGDTPVRWRGTTDADGRAKVFVTGLAPPNPPQPGAAIGRFKVKVSKQFYEPEEDELALTHGAGARELPYDLKPTGKRVDESQDSIEVTVLAGDRTLGGKPMPLGGASVFIGGKGISTDANGQVTLKGYFEDAVQVKATAPGYKSVTQMVSIRRGAVVRSKGGTGRATFTLQMGEDERSEDTPITLVVEVRDSFDNKPLKGAAVGFLELNGAYLSGGYTDDKGEQDYKSGDTPDKAVSDLRQGIKLDIRSKGYKELKGILVPADLLKPSFEPRKFFVAMERDWTDLRAAIAVLEGRVAAWNTDVRLVAEKVASVNRLVREASAAEAQAVRLSGEIAAAVTPDDMNSGRLSGETVCRRAGELKQSILQYEREALAKEQTVKQLLDNATNAAASCKSQPQALAAKRDYNAAVKLSAEIGALVNKARTANEQLARVSKELKGTPSTSVVENKLAELVELARAAEQAAINAEVDERRGTGLSRSLSGRHAALTGELATLRTANGIDSSGTGLPADLKQRLDEMAGLLGARNNDMMAGPDPNGPARVKTAAANIQAARADAERAVNTLKNTSAQCDVAPLDDAFERMGNAIVSASVELSAAASLTARADDCMKRGACQPLLADVRGLLERDELEAAESRISRARAESCDVSESVSELEYWRTVRQTANLIAGSLDSCRFQEALNIGLRIPPGIKSRPLVADALEVARRGAQSRQRITQLRESARRDVARTNQVAAAHPHIAQAEQAAEGFPCLLEEVARFRDEYKITALINKPPQLEELPEDADRPVETAVTTSKPKTGTKSGTRPQLEELPEEADSPVATNNTGRTGRAGRGRPRPVGGAGGGTRTRPQLEELPEEADTQTANTAKRRAALDVLDSANSTERNVPSPPVSQPVSKPTGPHWTLVSATVSPETPNKDWTYSAKSTTAQRLIYNGDKSTYQWTLPQQIDGNGFTMSLNVQTQPGPGYQMSSVISIAGSGMTSDTPRDEQGAYARSTGQPGQGASAQKSVTFKPDPSASELHITVALHWGGVVFRYTYRRAE